MEKNKKSNLKQVTYIIILSIVFVLFLAGYSIGKTINNIKINGQAEIAKPIIEVVSNSNLKITDINKEGECNFSIRNYNEQGDITEADLKYSITIKDQINKEEKETIIYELYKNGKKVELNNQTTEMMQLSSKKKQEDQYKLKVNYNKQASTTMGDIMDKVQIQVHSEQKEN